MLSSMVKEWDDQKTLETKRYWHFGSELRLAKNRNAGLGLDGYRNFQRVQVEAMGSLLLAKTKRVCLIDFHGNCTMGLSQMES